MVSFRCVLVLFLVYEQRILFNTIKFYAIFFLLKNNFFIDENIVIRTRNVLMTMIRNIRSESQSDTKVKVLHERISCSMKCP